MDKNYRHNIWNVFKECLYLFAAIKAVIPFLLFIIPLIIKILSVIGVLNLIDFINILLNYILIFTIFSLLIYNFRQKIIDIFEVLFIKRMYHRYIASSTTNQSIYRKINKHVYEQIYKVNGKLAINHQTITTCKTFAFVLNGEGENTLISIRDLKNITDKKVENYYFMMSSEFGEPEHKFTNAVQHLSFFITEKQNWLKSKELKVSHLSNNKNIHKVELDPPINPDESKCLYFQHKFPSKTPFPTFYEDYKVGFHILRNDLLDFSIKLLIYLDKNLFENDTYVLHVGIQIDELRKIKKNIYDLKSEEGLAHFIKEIISKGKDSKVKIADHEVLLCDKCYAEKAKNQICGLCGTNRTIPKKYVKFEDDQRDLSVNDVDILIIFKYAFFVKHEIGLK